MEPKEDILPMSKLPWAGREVPGSAQEGFSRDQRSGSVSIVTHLPCGYGQDNPPQSPCLDNGGKL